MESIQERGLPVVSLDVPSGLDADSGEILGSCLRADLTITFAAPKVGFGRARGPDRSGDVRVVDIGLPRQIWADG